MDKKNIHILCTGDLHLGRHPSRIPDEYDSRKFSPAFIWDKIIQKALDSKVDALVISGDIIDRDNRYFEAYGPFEAGIKKLAKENINVIAIAGNHDYDVLPELAHNINSDNFKFLGKGGNWEHQSLEKDGNKILNFIGWSYPDRQVRKNPLENIKMAEEDIPVIGIVHSEVNNPGSNYAPVSIDSLQEMDFVGWLLGHIHKPSLISNVSPFILNPGSPQPLNPNEQGIHGVWEVIIKSKNEFEIVRCPLASLEYINIEIDVSTLEKVEDLTSLLIERIEIEMDSSMIKEWIPDLIISRITLVGHTKLCREFDENKEKLKELEPRAFGCRVLIDKIDNQTRPPYDISNLATGSSQVALIAQYLLKLEAGNGDQLPEELLKKVEKQLLLAYRSNAYQPLRKQNRTQPPGRKEVYSILKKQARLLLDSLLAQKEVKRY